MEWEVIVALVIGVLITLFPAAFIWYVNIAGIYQAIRRWRTLLRAANYDWRA